MALTVYLQNATNSDELPPLGQFRHWARAAFTQASDKKKSELTIRIVDHVEGTFFNETYRHKKGPTNVLSFPAQLPTHIPCPLLGDLVICLPVVQQEASEQNKTFEQHIAHLTVHGVLHLLGFDHEEEKDAAIMEPLEIKILAGLGYPNPYHLESN